MSLPHFIKTLGTKYTLIGYMCSCFIIYDITQEHISWQIVYIILIIIISIYYCINICLYNQINYNYSYNIRIYYHNHVSIYSILYSLINVLLSTWSIIIPVCVYTILPTYIYGYISPIGYVYSVIGMMMLVSSIIVNISSNLSNKNLYIIIGVNLVSFILLYVLHIYTANIHVQILIIILIILLCAVSIAIINNMMDNISYSVATQVDMHFHPSVIRMPSVIFSIIFMHYEQFCSHIIYFIYIIISVCMLYLVYLYINIRNTTYSQKGIYVDS